MDVADVVSYWVKGSPAPKGSWDTVWNKALGRCVLYAKNSKAAKAWRKTIWAETKRAHVPRLMSGPVAVEITFYLPRAAKTPAHWRYRDIKPDGDKLERLVLDSLTDAAYRDDSQVCDLHWVKRYVEEGHETGAQISIGPLAQSETLFDEG